VGRIRRKKGRLDAGRVLAGNGYVWDERRASQTEKKTLKDTKSTTGRQPTGGSGGVGGEEGGGGRVKTGGGLRRLPGLKSGLVQMQPIRGGLHRHSSK